MTKEEIQREIAEIEKIHTSFEERLAALKSEQHFLVNDFFQKLENKKREELQAFLDAQP